MKRVFPAAFKKRTAVVFAVLLMAICLSGCAAGPLVGKRVDTRSPRWCAVRGLPQVCTVKTEYLDFTCKISKGAVADEYVIEGSATSVGLGSFTSLVDNSMGGGSPSRFELILVKDGVIRGSVPFTVLGNDLARELTFKRTFKSGPFDAMTFHYFINVRG